MSCDYSYLLEITEIVTTKEELKKLDRNTTIKIAFSLIKSLLLEQEIKNFINPYISFFKKYKNYFDEINDWIECFDEEYYNFVYNLISEEGLSFGYNVYTRKYEITVDFEGLSSAFELTNNTILMNPTNFPSYTETFTFEKPEEVVIALK